jgi:hypothetical protein
MKLTAKTCIIAAVLLATCGKRGDPKPPIPVIPKATTDLAITQRGPRMILSWSYPSLTTAGANLGGISRVDIYRYTEELPVPIAGHDIGKAPNAIDSSVPAAFAQFARVPTLTPVQFDKLKQKVDSIDEANLRGATVGARLSYEDQPPLAAADGRPVRLTYAVVIQGRTAKSDLSNLALAIPLDVPTAPTGLTATAKPEGINLSWSAPNKGISGGSKPALIGYHVYRVSSGETAGDLDKPITASPITTTSYTDVPPYGSYQYVVTAVASVGPPRLESVPSAAAKATYEDLQAPLPPTGLTALIEEKAVRLVWDAVDAPDLRGYRVYRWEGPVRLTLTPLDTATYFRDISMGIGIDYKYEVTSIDKKGNESAPASTMALVPKTP